MQTRTQMGSVLTLAAVAIAVLALTTTSANAVIIGFEAESGTLGSEFDPAQADGTALGGFYITTETNNQAPNSDRPNTDPFTVSYSLNVAAGTYDVYVRARVGPGNPNDDSFHYANSFGNADPNDPGDWATLNGANAAGVPIGSFGWSNALATTVTSAGGIVTWEIGAREDGFDMDAFALVTTGQSVTDTELDNAVVPPPVPEPSTVILAALGLMGLAGTRRRRNR